MEGDKGPVEEELLKYGQKGRVAGLVAGNYGEVSEALKQLAIFAAKHEALKESYYMDSTVETREKVRAKCERKITNLWGLTIHRGWARLLIDRTALLIREETFDSQDEEGEEGDGEEGIGEIH